MTEQQTAAMRLAAESVSKAYDLIAWGHTERAAEILKGTHTALRQVLEQQPCKYPNCLYPCPDLPDCRDAEQPAQQEPVAWISKHGVVYPFDAKDEVHPINDLQPLYTSPPAQRKPLTVEKILHLVDTYVGAPSMSYPLDSSDWINFARAIEAAHGIKGET